MQKLPPTRRAELSELILAAKSAKGWSQESLAKMAESHLRRASETDEYATPEERRLWRNVSVTRHHIGRLTNCPARPLTDMESRARLLGIVLALGLDRALVNRLAGGL